MTSKPSIGTGISSSGTSLAGRILAIGGNEVAEAERLRLLRLFFMVHLGYELLLTSPWEVLGGDPVVFSRRGAYSGFLFAAAIALLLVAYRLRPEHQLSVTRLITILGIGAVLWLFPGVPNHLFLVVFCLLIFALVDLDQPDEALLGLQALRLTTAIVLFYTGLQKLLYGSYFRAEFMTWAIANTDRFSASLGRILPSAEFERLQSLPPGGPFGTDWWPLLLLSNSVWIFELTMPILLLWPRTRGWATLAAVIFVGLIEAGAREWLFGGVYLSLLLLFPKRNFLHRAVPAFLLIYGLLLTLAVARSLLGLSWREPWLL